VSAIPAGAVFNGSTPTSDAVQILIDNAPVSLQYSGLSGAGLYQFNLTVPNLPAGDHTVSATIAGVTTPGTVWLATQ
jgi:uncharacterized protein (TIGR03437 family)